MENENNNQGQQIQIEVPAEEMQGKYANLAMITHGPQHAQGTCSKSHYHDSRKCKTTVERIGSKCAKI